MPVPREIAEPTLWRADTGSGDSETPETTFTRHNSGLTDLQAASQALEDRAHNRGWYAGGKGVLYGLRASGTDLTVDVSGGRVMIGGGTYSESGANIGPVTVTDDATTYLWVRGADYTTEQSTDATTLVFGTSAAAATPPDTDYEWLLFAKAVASSGTVTATNCPAGMDWASSRQGHWVRVWNASGSAITRGRAVFCSGIYTHTTDMEYLPEVTLADGTDVAKLPVMGLAATDIANGAAGWVQMGGAYIDHPDESSWSAGDRIYVEDDGTLTDVAPTIGGAFVGVYDSVSSLDALWLLPGATGDALGTASTTFAVGDGTDGDIYLYASNGDANRPALKYDASSNQWEYSNDGSAFNAIGTGGGAGTPADTVTAETSFGASSSAGVAATYSRGDHTHGTPSLSDDDPEDIEADNAKSEGTGTAASRVDHVHAITTAAAGALGGTAGSVGTAVSLARSDHGHVAFNDANTPMAIASSATVGTSATASRDDHVHELGTGVVDTDHIAAGSITAAKLQATNSPTDNYYASYDSATGGVTWEPIAGSTDEKVKVDSGAGSAGYIGANATDGVLRAETDDLSYTDGGDFVTLGLATKHRRKHVPICVFASDVDVSVGDGTAGFFIFSDLNGFNLVGVEGGVAVAGTTGTTDVQIRRSRGAATRSDADMLSTKLTIDSGETSSATAATAAVVNTSNDDVATGDMIYVDVDAVSTTEPQGLTVVLVFEEP